MKLKLALIGNPIEHSLSPKIYAFLGKRFNIDISYDLIVPKDKSEEGLKNIITDYDAVNITYPFKNIAAGLVTNDITSVNLLLKIDDVLQGFNTDGVGFLNSMRGYSFQKVLILGSGATALNIYKILTAARYKCAILARNTKTLNKNIMCYRPEDGIIDTSYDLVINATSLTSSGIPFEYIIDDIILNSNICVDVNYRGELPFLERARQVGKLAIDGKGLLKHQAAYSFYIFCNKSVPYEKIRDAVREMEL